MEAFGNLLLVEDEETLADNLHAFLSKRCKSIKVASSVDEALATLANFTPDFAVVDYCLAGKNGLHLLDQLQHSHPACRAVMITGHPSDEVLRGASARGVLDVLFKPFPLGELELALARSRTAGPARPAAAPWAVESAWPRERRSTDRRRGFFAGVLCFPLRLPDGSWLFTDRRRTERRHEQDTQDSRGKAN